MFNCTTNQLSLWSADDAVDAWQIRESPRARRLSVKVLRGGRVVVIVPRRTSQRTVAHFLRRHGAWIERKRAESRRNAPPVQPFPPQDIELSACEELWRVHVAGGSSRVSLETTAPRLLSLAGRVEDARAVRRVLRRWLVAKAHATFAPLLAAAAREFGFSYSKMTIRRQRTRWGSCSARGAISLNCTLLFQKPEVVRYLLIHELSHTRHLNHSKRFWDCVARCCARYEHFDRELRDGWKRVPAWVFDGRAD